ncbi:MAG: cation:proton antiporter [Myxococcota bacterium]|nr:cation:proton antiporter [Myxococcota bacterium]
MEHELTLISTIAAGAGLALLLGLAAERLKIPALVGYLVAGVLLGPATPGFVADMEIAAQLSDLGVMLLMFGVGLHFSLKDLLAVKRIAVLGALVQMAIATLLGAALASWWGWSLSSAVIFGLSLSCASTVVLVKALQARDQLQSVNGRIALGWLVVEDLATVLALVLLPPLAALSGAASGNAGSVAALSSTVSMTVIEISVFIGVMLMAGRYALPWLLWQVSRTGSRELFTLAVVAAAVSIAYAASELFSVSFALGAFFAGMMMRESEYGHRAAAEALPFQDAFSVLFFVAVGMLFDPLILVEEPLRVMAVVGIIVIAKSLAAGTLVLALRYPLNTALTVSVSLAQIGEFSFILAGLGRSLDLLPAEGMSLVLAGAIISIALNPFLFSSVAPISRWIVARSVLARRFERRRDPFARLPSTDEVKQLKAHVVLVGVGCVGAPIAETLLHRGIPYVVVEQNRELVKSLRSRGVQAVVGSAAEPSILSQARTARAAMIILAIPDSVIVRQIIGEARKLNPHIEIVVRCHNAEEAAFLRAEEKGGVFFFGEEELAKSMARHVLRYFNR